MQLPCYADRLTSVLCSFSSLVIRNRHRVAMYFHAPCGVVLYIFVCKLYANKEKKTNELASYLTIVNKLISNTKQKQTEELSLCIEC